jgi:hypothetical protein
MTYNYISHILIRLYRLAFSIMHRILSFVSRHKIRLNYHWVELWPSLTSTLHFTAQRLEDLKFKEEFNVFLASVSFINQKNSILY